MTTPTHISTPTLSTPTDTAASAAPDVSGRVHTVVDSPIGPLTLVADGDGNLCGVFMDTQRHLPDAGTFGPVDAAPFAAVVTQLGEYFAGGRREFDVPLVLHGTPFQQQVWSALREIPYGQTWSYGELAARIGKPGASRAVGLANGRNPVSIVVPCHRVVGSNGSLTGYGGGLDRKRVLLALEQGAAGDGQLSLV